MTYDSWFFFYMLAAALLLSSAATEAADSKTGSEADHAELRTLLTSITDAINVGDIKILTPHLHQPFSATLIDQQLVTTPAELQTYFDEWVGGEGAFIRKVVITPEVDALTEIYDGKFGIARGGNLEQYDLATGKSYTLKSRWTATVIKDDGKWKLLALHTGVNFVDNPVMAAVAGEGVTFGLVGGAAGLLAGLLLSWGYGRSRRRRAKVSEQIRGGAS